MAYSVQARGRAIPRALKLGNGTPSDSAGALLIFSSLPCNKTNIYQRGVFIETYPPKEPEVYHWNVLNMNSISGSLLVYIDK